jgi:hypothetical protein
LTSSHPIRQGEILMKKGGEIVIVLAEHMPTRTGLAAIYRF